MDNKFMLMGRICNISELGMSSNNNKYLNFTIAKRNFKKEDLFFDCVSFGHIAEVVSNLKKGSCISVSGWLDLKKDKEGKKKVSLVVDEFSYCPVNKSDSSDNYNAEDVPF